MPSAHWIRAALVKVATPILVIWWPEGESEAKGVARNGVGLAHLSLARRLLEGHGETLQADVTHDGASVVNRQPGSGFGVITDSGLIELGADVVVIAVIWDEHGLARVECQAKPPLPQHYFAAADLVADMREIWRNQMLADSAQSAQLRDHITTGIKA